MRQRRDLPDYAACEGCGEYFTVTLCRVAGHVVCENCRDTSHPRRRCAICNRVAPSELHHVASARQHPTLTIAVCLNCHRILSQRQYHWHPAWRSEAHSMRYIVQGILDVVALWLERSPVAEQCQDPICFLGRAALCLMAYLHFDALHDLGFLTDWT